MYLLDIQAARAVAQANLFERAVNHPGPWAIRIGETTEWAVRIRTSNGVVFLAHFAPGTKGDVAWLGCDGTEVSSKEISIDGEGFMLEWKLGLSKETIDV